MGVNWGFIDFLVTRVFEAQVFSGSARILMGSSQSVETAFIADVTTAAIGYFEAGSGAQASDIE
ncbi:hypothetical protein [Yersinia massiliensis]|uniref:hypothetical protein n=1 Tax=Yersinia massiliensis TaxID=419257 RepID=UPI000C15A6A2|nr:hypothetical protein [Yersinia massiliensis]PHZ21680.1 hypothetical protein CS535_21230 [Yersinia massiliensis]